MNIFVLYTDIKKKKWGQARFNYKKYMRSEHLESLTSFIKYSLDAVACSGHFVSNISGCELNREQ